MQMLSVCCHFDIDKKRQYSLFHNYIEKESGVFNFKIPDRTMMDSTIMKYS